MISAKGAVPNRNVRIRNDGNSTLTRRTDRPEHAVGIIIPKRKTGTGLDLQMERIQCRRAERQADADDAVWNIRLLIFIFAAAEHLCAACRGGINAALRQLRRAAVRANGIRIRQRQRAIAVIDVVRLRTEGRRARRCSQQNDGKQRRYPSFQV